MCKADNDHAYIHILRILRFDAVLLSTIIYCIQFFCLLHAVQPSLYRIVVVIQYYAVRRSRQHSSRYDISHCSLKKQKNIVLHRVSHPSPCCRFMYLFRSSSQLHICVDLAHICILCLDAVSLMHLHVAAYYGNSFVCYLQLFECSYT